jgi:hypothetical protein
MRRLGRRAAATLVGAVLASGLLLPATEAGAGAPAGSPTSSSCAWTSHLDPTVANVLFPDQAASYWGLTIPALPGETLTIRGQYPHARYMSFTSYNPVLQSADGLNDQAIAPDPGSVNPFLIGASRRAVHRSYTAMVVFGRRPASPAPNTLYTTSADGSRTGSEFHVVYRVYRPDRGLDATGAVGLPSVTVNLPGGGSTTFPACNYPSVPPNGINTTVADTSVGYPPDRPYPGTDPPTWHKFYNGLTSLAELTDNGVTGTDVSGRATPGIMAGTPGGGFLDNPDNKYIFALLRPAAGTVALIRAALPTFPHTYQGQPVMGTGQLRYWSLCSNEAFTERFYACLADDQVATDSTGTYTLVISSAADRPPNARPACGINWLPTGPAPDTLLILRNMLPAPSFSNSVQAARYGHEAQDMGPYFPATHYTTAAAVKALGCR